MPATRGSKKDSDRAITPAVEAVHVPAHLVPPGSPQAKQLRHLHAQLSLGQSCHRQKNKSCILYMQGLFGSVSVDCALPGFSVREGGSPGKNTGAYWPILVAIPFWSTIFPTALATNTFEYLVLAETLRPNQLHHLHTWPSQDQTQILQGSLRSKSQWKTHMQRWK